MDEVTSSDGTPGSPVLTCDVKSGHNLSENQLCDGHWSPDKFSVNQALAVEKGYQHHFACCQSFLRLLWMVLM